MYKPRYRYMKYFNIFLSHLKMLAQQMLAKLKIKVNICVFLLNYFFQGQLIQKKETDSEAKQICSFNFN